MPRGVPKNGHRNRQNRVADLAALKAVAVEPTVFETDAEIAERLNDRFDILKTLTAAALDGDCRALIVSGPAGLGKSFTVEAALEDWDPSGYNHTIIKGFVKATGLYRTLFQYKEAGQVIVFDDADSIFFDDVSLNLLKAVCDTTERRKVSYLAESNMVDEETGERVPRSFDFNGTIIFITNLDFDASIERGHKLAPHMSAMVSRAHYIDLAMKTKRDYMVRIKQVVAMGMLTKMKLDDTAQADVVNFIESNIDKMRELSLRMAIKVGHLRKAGGNWEKIARVTCCK